MGSVYADRPRPTRSKSAFSHYFSGTTSTLSVFERLLEPHNVTSLRPLLNGLRVVKSESEINLMRRVGQLSGRAITEAMREHFVSENDMWAFLEYRFKKQGCDRSAYVPVIAGGEVSWSN